MKHITLIFSILSMILLVFTVLDIYVLYNPQQFHFGPVIWAEKLSAKPAEYIVVTDPDPYLLEALSNAGTGSNPGRDVFIGSWDNTNIDELVETYETFDVEYGDAFYTVHLEVVDPVYGVWLAILFIAWIGLGFSFVIVTVLRHSKRSVKFPDAGSQTVCSHCGANIYANDIFKRIKDLIG